MKPMPVKGGFVLAVVFAVALVLSAGKEPPRVGAHGETKTVGEPFPHGHGPNCPIGCATCQDAIDRALQWLSKTKEARPQNQSQNAGRNSMQFLAALAFVAEGSTPSQGKYKENVARYVKFATSHKFGGYFESWDLAFAGLFLAEIQQKEPSDQVRHALQGIVSHLERTQEKNMGARSGAWRHNPKFSEALGGRFRYETFLAVSEWCLAVLARARQLGLTVSDEALQRGLEYVEHCQNGNGGLGYDPNPFQKPAHEPARTAAALPAIRWLNQAESPLYKRASGYLAKHWDTLISEPHASLNRVPCLFCGCMGAYLLGGEHWKQYKSLYWDVMLGLQASDGHFEPLKNYKTVQRPGIAVPKLPPGGADTIYGASYTTAVIALTLQVPQGKLACLGGSLLTAVKFGKLGSKEREQIVSTKPTKALDGAQREQFSQYMKAGNEALAEANKVRGSAAKQKELLRKAEDGYQSALFCAGLNTAEGHEALKALDKIEAQATERLIAEGDEALRRKEYARSRALFNEALAKADADSTWGKQAKGKPEPHGGGSEEALYKEMEELLVQAYDAKIKERNMAKACNLYKAILDKVGESHPKGKLAKQIIEEIDTAQAKPKLEKAEQLVKDGSKDEAGKMLEELIENFPGTPSASRAVDLHNKLEKGKK